MAAILWFKPVVAILWWYPLCILRIPKLPSGSKRVETFVLELHPELSYNTSFQKKFGSVYQIVPRNCFPSIITHWRAYGGSLWKNHKVKTFCNMNVKTYPEIHVHLAFLPWSVPCAELKTYAKNDPRENTTCQTVSVQLWVSSSKYIGDLSFALSLHRQSFSGLVMINEHFSWGRRSVVLLRWAKKGRIR